MKRFTTWLPSALLLFAIPAILALPSCKREDAVWGSDWELPLLNDTLNLSKLVEDTIMEVNSSGYYELAIDRTVFELKLADFVEIPDTTVEHSYPIPLNNFNVTPGFSFVNNVQEHVIDMPGIELKKIRVKEGGIDVRVESPVETITFFTVEIPGAFKDGVQLSKVIQCPAGTNANPGVVNTNVDLTGYEIDLRGANQGSYNKIQTKMIVKSDPNGPQVTVNNQDVVRFSFTMNDLKLNYARGYFGERLITDTLDARIDGLAKIRSGLIDLPAANLELELENSIKLNAKIMLTQLKSTNEEGQMVAMEHPQLGDWLTINSATGNEASLQSTHLNLAFTPDNSNLEQYLENHGAQNTVGYALQINPWGNTSGGWDEIFPQSSLKVKLKGDMPLTVGLTDLVLLDTFPFSFKQDFTRTHISSGTIWLKATNAFPLRGDVLLSLVDISGNTIATIPSSSIVESSVYGTIVNGVQQKQSYLEFVLPESVTDQLESVSNLMVRLTLNTPNAGTGSSEPVSVPAGAFFGFKVGAKLKVENRL